MEFESKFIHNFYKCKTSSLKYAITVCLMKCYMFIELMKNFRNVMKVFVLSRRQLACFKYRKILDYRLPIILTGIFRSAGYSYNFNMNKMIISVFFLCSNSRMNLNNNVKILTTSTFNLCSN